MAVQLFSLWPLLLSDRGEQRELILPTWTVALNRIDMADKTRKKAPKSSSNSPATSSSSPSPSSSKVRCVCASPLDSGHMVECESCSYWSHSKCVNISTTLASLYPFVCPFCVKSLFSELAKLRSEVSDLRTQVSSLSSHVTQSISLSTELERVGESLAQFTSSMEVLKSKSGSSDVSTADGIVHPTPVSPRQSLLPHTRPESHESRRGNLVISGIPECPQGTRKAERLVQDQASVAAVLSSVSPSVTSQSIRDLFRLGKYKADRHRPILVKLHKYWDASIILSNKQRLSSSPEISICPDLSPTQMVTLSLLVKKTKGAAVIWP